MKEIKSPFDIINTLSYKNYINDFDNIKKYYLPFIINRHYSLFPDTIYLANLLNIYGKNSNDLKWQYDYWFYGTKKQSRFAKWPKKETKEELDAISEWYNCSITKAKEYKKILNEEQLDMMMMNRKENKSTI